jgi:aspartate/glutamate racemase
MKNLAIIHTTLATTTSLPPLAAEILPGVALRHFVDDSILPQLQSNDCRLSDVEDRVIHYVQFAAQAGADIILCACSSIGEIMPVAQKLIRVPIIRIDEAMVEEAVQRGSVIGVAATLNTTLGPTSRLIAEKAAQAGKEIQVKAKLIEDAYQKLVSGDSTGHDALLLAAFKELASNSDIVVLAQASMARVLPTLPTEHSGRFLSSPRLGLHRVRAVMEGLQ